MTAHDWIAIVPTLVVAALLVVGITISVAATRFRKHTVFVSALLIVVLMVIVVLSLQPQPSPSATATILLVALGAVFSSTAASPIQLSLIGVAFSKTTVEGEANESGASTRHTGEVLRGGSVISALERIAGTISVVAGFPEGIAIVVAIKSVGQITDKKHQESLQRFVIGTLVSLTWASVTGLAIRFIIT